MTILPQDSLSSGGPHMNKDKSSHTELKHHTLWLPSRKKATAKKRIKVEVRE